MRQHELNSIKENLSALRADIHKLLEAVQAMKRQQCKPKEIKVTVPMKGVDNLIINL